MADYNSTATSTIYVNGKPAEQELQRLKQRASDLQDAMAKAGSAGNKADLKKFKSELTSTRREIKNVENSMHSAEIVMKRLNKATPRELNLALRQLKKELNDIERGSDAWNKQVAKIKRVKAELDSVNAEMREHQSLLSRLNDGINKWGMSIASAAAALTGITMTVRQAVDAYAGMDQEMANVQKFTGMSRDGVEDLNEEFKKIDTRTGREELNQLAQEAGRLGKSSQEDVLGFVRASDKINVALDDLGEGATLTLSKLTGVFGVEAIYGTEKSLLKVGSVINELSQNSAAAAPYIAEFTSRLGGVGSQAGMTVQQIMAYGAVLDANQQQLESSATALSQLIVKLYRDPAKYAKAAGLDVQKFTALLKKDANEAVLTLLDTLNKAGGMDALAPMFADMGENGARSITTLSMLASKIGEVRAQQQAANLAFEEGTSIDREFDVQNNTVQAGLDKAKNKFHEMAVELGEKLAPAARYAITGTSALMKVVSGAVTFFDKYKAAIATLAVAIVGYTLALKANTIAVKSDIVFSKLAAATKAIWRAGVYSVTAAYNLLTGSLGRAGAAWRALNGVIKINPWGLAIAGITAVVGGLITMLSRMRDAEREAKRVAEENRKWRKSIVDIDEASNRYSSGELARVKSLYEAATKENSARKDRIDAAKKLISLYPSILGNFSAEAIAAGKAKDAYDRLTGSIIQNARARAAAEKIQENEKTILDLNDTIQANEAWNTNAGKRASRARARQRRNNDRNSSQHAFMPGGVQTKNEQDLNDEIRDNEHQQEIARRNIRDSKTKKLALQSANRRLAKIPGVKAVLVDGGSGGSAPSVDYSGSGATGGGSAGGGSHGGSGNHEDKFAVEKAWRKQQEDQAKLDFALDILDQRGFNYRMSEIAQGYFSKLMANPKATSAEHLEAEANYYEEIKKYLKLFDDADLEDFEAAYKRSMADLTQQYIDNNISLEDFNRQSEALELDHLKKAVDKHKEGTKERLAAETAYQNALKQQHEREQQEMEDNYKKLYEQQQKMNELRLEYFGMSDEEKQQAYDTAVATLDAIYQQELKKFGDNNKKKLELERKYQSAKEKIRKGIFDGDDLGDGQNAKSWDQWTGTWLDKAFGEGTWEKYGDVVKSGVASIGNIYKGLTSLVEAEEQKKLQAMTKKYDAEIKAAEGNQYRINQIQKRREAEEKRIKDASNKRAMAMELAQAMSTTALAAINAYSSAAKIPLTGWILAPVAAGLALAAGAVQIAAIRKQHQVQSQGYSEGGYTRPGAKDEPAGIVHAGEWVASRKLLASPVARPMIEFLDHAQRTNTIGRLAMPSSPIRSGASSVLAPAQPVVVTESRELRDTIRQLNKRLNEPFVTINTVAGDHGIKQAQDEYKKLMNNTLPKNKRT